MQHFSSIEFSLFIIIIFFNNNYADDNGDDTGDDVRCAGKLLLLDCILVTVKQQISMNSVRGCG